MPSKTPSLHQSESRFFNAFVPGFIACRRPYTFQWKLVFLVKSKTALTLGT